MSKPRTGVAICHYNRTSQLEEIIQAVKDTVNNRVKIVVCDDGSETWEEHYMENYTHPAEIANRMGVLYVQGPNLGVAANKNRALWALQDMDFICILEDDLKPIKQDWITHYERAATLSGLHHFCRVQDKLVSTLSPDFDEYMKGKNLTPIYGPSPRGDLTFITRKVITEVGGFNKKFKGAGYAHGEWSNRVNRAGLIRHPNIWVDIAEGANSFIQVGDTEGGRWDYQKRTKAELEKNRAVRARLDKNPYIYDRLELQ